MFLKDRTDTQIAVNREIITISPIALGALLHRHFPAHLSNESIHIFWGI